jgi:DNA-binding transcriptional LysR family regulator
MIAKSISWELYRSFLAVARCGSLSGAARSLRLTQPTLGRHIDELEQALGTPIFTRSQQGLLATETAAGLVPIAEAMESAAQAMERVASGTGAAVTGVVRVTASDIVGAEVLPSILADFTEQYPDIAFELHLSNRTQDLLQRDADIAVRMVRPTQTGLVARQLGHAAIGFYAHQSYLLAKGRPKTLADLAKMRLIGYDRNPVPIEVIAQAEFFRSRESFSLRTDSDLAQLAAIRAGYGVGACQIGIARRDSNLERVLRKEFALPLETWLVMHEDLSSSPRVRKLFDHLGKGLKVYLASSR